MYLPGKIQKWPRTTGKRGSMSLVIREMLTKTLRYDFTLTVRMAVIFCFKMVNNKCLSGSVWFPRFYLITTKIWSDGSAFQLVDRPASQLSDGPVLELRVTAQFYLENSKKIHPQGVEGMPTQRHEERERDIKTESVPVGRKDRPGPVAPLFICFSSPPWACPM